MSWKSPENNLYTKSDEWILIDEQTATIGITDYAQDQLSDIVYVELPTIGDNFKAKDIFATVESVKAAADVNIPVDGLITEVNNSIEDEPELINSDPYGVGWIIKISISDITELDGLLDALAYKELLG